MIAWQGHCQRRWLAAVRPSVVAWPWENHAWERALVRDCRSLGIRTLGYQHATVARREWNYAPWSNSDGEASLPDRVACVGAADQARLAALGHARARLAVAGALRFRRGRAPAFDPTAPVFVALPFDPALAAELVAAIRPLGAAGRAVLVKDHPMTPFAVAPSPGVAACATPLSEVPAVSAVISCITTVGLEAVLAGLPTIRFLPRSCAVVDAIPDGVAVPTATTEELAEVLAAAAPPMPPALDQVFAAVDMEFWRRELAP